jgi:hypothetical protein
VSINSFLAKVSANGGMSFSNNFVVMFSGIANDYFDDEELEYFCDEAQLPGVNTATGTQNGVYLGVGSVDYPHTRIFTEFQLSFLLDANLSILKGLNKWYDGIFGEEERLNGSSAPVSNRINRLKYRSEYASTILVTKTELGPNSPTERRPITYVMENAYPYAIDAIPLQFGSSQLMRVTAQFKYERHYTTVQDIRGVKGSIDGMDNQYKKGQANVVKGEMSKTSKEPINWDPKVAAGGGTKLPIGIEQVNQGIA